MHLDKTKLRELIEKTKNLDVSFRNNDFNVNKSVIQQLNTSLSALSSWLKKHPTLVNGSTYGRKLVEIKNKLTANNHFQFGSWTSATEIKELQKGLLSLLTAIDKENKSIFIVHGRNHDMREMVQSALRGLGIATVVLDREDDEGQTVMEKFEKEAKRCEYAVVLCSADDEGRLRAKGRNAKDAPIKLRARQNVVLELGYFLALVGRKNVFVLHPEESIEQPSDFTGVIYQTYDKAGTWKAKLVRELKKAGFKIPTKFSDRL